MYDCGVNMYFIKEFEKEDINNVIEFEKQLRIEEPNTYFWDIDDDYVKNLENSFKDPRFINSFSFLAYKKGKVVGRIDSSIISSKTDASCCSAYLDWICVLKSERHHKVAQLLISNLRQALKKKGVEVIIALMANNEESQNFYKSIENASIHDMGIWIKV